MAPLTHDGHGNMLNTNADTIAGETAKALSALFDVTLVYCFEKKGCLLYTSFPQYTPASLLSAENWWEALAVCEYALDTKEDEKLHSQL